MANTTRLSVTNQQMITAIYKVAKSVGRDGWDLLSRAGLTGLVRDRQGQYQGPGIEDLPGLTAQEKSLLGEALGLPVETPVAGAPPVSGETPTAPSQFTHQQLITAIYKVAQVDGLSGWSLLESARLTYLVQNRQAIYSGTPIDELPGLSSAQKARLKAELGLPVEAAPSAPTPTPTPTPTPAPTPSPAPTPAPALQFTNQEVINAIYAAARAIGQQGWTLLSRAGLTHLVQDRQGVYQGPAIDALPGLSAAEKAQLKAALGLPTEAAPTGFESEIKWQGPSPNQEYTRYGYPIEMIVVHYTASGSTAGTVSWFMNPDSQVSVHYIVGRDGEIVQLVKDEYRAHHAGQGPLSGQSAEIGEKRRQRNRTIQPNNRSLGIEIVNWGPLEKRDGKYYTWMGNECPGEVVSKGGRYWQVYTAPQLASVIKLVTHLCKKHNIPAQYPPSGPGAFEPDDTKLATFKGILGHSALDDQKQDPGPHFDWDHLLAGVQEGLKQT